MPRNTAVHFALLVLSTCAGCYYMYTGPRQEPDAHRIQPDTNDRHYPQRDIVEHGQRAKGVLVYATPGYENAYRSRGATVLVPTPPSPLEGPVWSEHYVTDAEAFAIYELPRYRNAYWVGIYGNVNRGPGRRDEPLSTWVLGTDPFILGLGAGQPRRTWIQYALTATAAAEDVVGEWSPLNSFVARYVVDEELDQPLARVVVYPPDFWARATATDSLVSNMWSKGVEVSVVTLPRPLSVDEVLDALAAAGDATELGPFETVALTELFGGDETRKANE